MKEQDKIEKLKDSTLHTYKLDDGILDMTMGLILCLISIGTRLHNPGLLWIFVFAFIMLTKGLKKKYVYPRVGIAMFADTTKQDIKIKTSFIAIFLIMGLVGYLLFGASHQSVSWINPIIIILGILISGAYILGGFSQNHVFYLAGLGLAIPIAGIQFSKGLWLGISLTNAILVILLALIYWTTIKGKTKDDKYTAHRPSLVFHSLLMIAGVLCFIYFILLTYFPLLALRIKTWSFTHQILIMGNLLAVAVLIIGIIYKEFRYYMYAVLMSIMVLTIKVLLIKTISLRVSFFIIGILIMTFGFILLNSFTMRHPILKREKDGQDKS